MWRPTGAFSSQDRQPRRLLGLWGQDSLPCGQQGQARTKTEDRRETDRALGKLWLPPMGPAPACLSASPHLQMTPTLQSWRLRFRTDSHLLGNPSVEVAEAGGHQGQEGRDLEGQEEERPKDKGCEHMTFSEKRTLEGYSRLFLPLCFWTRQGEG